MRQHSVIAFAGILVLLMGGCTLFGGGEETGEVAPSPAESPTPVAATPATPASPAAQPNPTATAQPQFDKPTVAQRPPNTGAVAGLIPSTNSDVRIRQIQTGRQDPFAVVPVPVPVTVRQTGVEPPAGVSPRPIRVVPPPPLPGVPPTIRQKIPRGQAGQAGTGRRNLPRPGNMATAPRGVRPGTAPGTGSGAAARRGAAGTAQGAARGGAGTTNLPPAFRPTLPPLPEPTLAQSVEVSGVVQVGSVPQAIVKAPNEPNSRYIRAGDRLSNGQVLVKRIEMNEGLSPVVVLEQYGREVEKRVGERSTPTANQGQQAATPGNATGT